MTIPQMAKAIAAAVTAGGAALGTALLDGHVDGGEIITIVVAVVGALGIVFQVPNAPRDDDAL